MFGCAQKPVKSIENLKAAYNGESTASAKYAAFAEKAKAEGFDTVAVMFLATSKAEAIHAANHLKVLEKLGEKVEGPEIGAFVVLSTAENLDDAMKGETYEVETMYPGFIAAAESEKVKDAVKSFSWAVDTEKKHQAFYKKALDALNSGGESGLPLNWLVCPVCGNTYDLGSVTTACDFCMTNKEKFIAF
ncbi:MAG: rubrerythrin family protein [Bacteroidales bacterium]|nr:rubrerythrin family protein [Bacteroidales bacterium]